MKKSEFHQFDGQDGKLAYIAYKGKIYSVTESKHWRNGRHMNSHSAGEDLTYAFSGAPHGEEVLDRIKQVGILEDGIEYTHMNKNKDKLIELYGLLHPHPVSIHFPIGAVFLGIVLQLAFVISKKASFEEAAFYVYFLGAVSEFPAIASGIFSWWLNYNFAITSIFKNKIVYSAILMLMSWFVVITRFFIPDISFRGDMLSIIYNIFIFSSAFVVFILGFYGGKITWH